MEAEAGEIRRLLDGARQVLVVSHKDADGDTLGSALAMMFVVAGLGKDAVIRVPPPVPDIYEFLPGFDRVNVEPEGFTPDLVLVMDASNLERVDRALDGLAEATPIVNIDHHVSNTRFGDVNLVVPEACSTAEVTCDILHSWGIEITAEVATNIYAGVLTDTGGFRHENTTERALAIAGEMVSRGASAADIAMRIYKSKKLSTIKLQALAMGTIAFECDDRLVHAYVTKELLERAGASPDETEGIIDILNSTEGLELALLFKEIGPRETKISIRSRGQANANVLAQGFGGGGHERAAGAEIKMPLPEAMEAVLADARRMISDPAG
ncbi:MAG: bifunctional oligoribonuclease and phosphatase NrnA [Chloroflexota bacterium]|jgi:phosphoesterase RecJ-like protein|nr:bifunctional oligoribonuclease and phosphatase NrnA [Chloroflexota bacterium]